MTTLLVPWGKTLFGASIASHSSHGSSNARLTGADGAHLDDNEGDGALSLSGGEFAATNPMCSPSTGANPLSLNPSSTACRARNRDSTCSLYGPASSITASKRTGTSAMFKNLLTSWLSSSARALI